MVDVEYEGAAGDPVQTSRKVVKDGGEWKIDLADKIEQRRGLIRIATVLVPGDTEINGECAEPINGDAKSAGTFVLPGSYDVGYHDADGIAEAPSVTITVTDVSGSPSVQIIADGGSSWSFRADAGSQNFTFTRTDTGKSTELAASYEGAVSRNDAGDLTVTMAVP